MEINIKENSTDKVLVELCGELDTAAVATFVEKMGPVMNDAGKEIILDFSPLEYISSAGMRALLQLNKNAAAKGGSVCIKGMSEDIMQIFQMVGFDKMFTINPA